MRLLLLLLLIFSVRGEFDWSISPGKGEIPKGAAGAVMVKIDGYLVVFGGVQECINNTFPCVNEFYNDIYMYHISTEEWTKPHINGPKPPARSFFRAIAHSRTHSMYIYGGVVYSSIDGTIFEPFGDMWRFDIRTLTWTQLANDPGNRIDQAMAIVDDNIYLHGGLVGFGGTTEQILKNDMWRYHIPSGTWTLLTPSNFSDPSLPPIRYQARFEYNDDDIIVLYGGDVLPDNTQPRYDTWLYHVSTNTWEKFDDGSVLPLFTGIAAANKNVFYIATGEMRYGTEVQCQDPITQKKNNPVNKAYVIDISEPGTTYIEVNPVFNISPNEQAAYTRAGNKLYLWGGFNFYCVSSGAQGASDHRAVIKYNNNVWTVTVPKNL